MGHVARMEERRGVYRFLGRKPEGKRPLGRPSLRRGMILRSIVRKWDISVCAGSSWLSIGQVTGNCDCGNEPAVYINAWNFFTSRKIVSFSRRTLLHGVSK